MNENTYKAISVQELKKEGSMQQNDSQNMI